MAVFPEDLIMKMQVQSDLTEICPNSLYIWGSSWIYHDLCLIWDSVGKSLVVVDKQLGFD